VSIHGPVGLDGALSVAASLAGRKYISWTCLRGGSAGELVLVGL